MITRFTKGQPVTIIELGHAAVVYRAFVSKLGKGQLYHINDLVTGDRALYVAESELVERDCDEGIGLYNKYDVMRVTDPDGKHEECEYFVLDLMHDEFAIPALKAYRDAIHRTKKYPELAKDLNEKINDMYDRMDVDTDEEETNDPA